MLFRVSIAATLLGVAAAVGIYKVPLQKRSLPNNEQRLGIAEATGAGYEGLKIGYRGGSSDPRSIVVNDYIDSAFVAKIGLGTPLQEFQVVLDTGSSNLWISNKKQVEAIVSPAVVGSPATELKIITVYDRSKATEHGGFQLFYGETSKTLSGFLLGDELHLGGMNIPTCKFGEVESRAALQPVIDFGSTRIDGVLGLAFFSGGSAAEQIIKIESPLHSIKNTGLLESNVFAFYLSTGGANDELVIGGVDSSHYEGAFTYQPVIDLSHGKSGFWAIALEDVKVSGNPLTLTAHKAVIDSGTSLIAMPQADAFELAQRLTATPLAIVHPINKQYRVKCTLPLPNVDFVIGGNTYTLTKEDYLIQMADTTYCMLAFVGMDAPAPLEKVVLLGDIFLRAHYVKFDMDNKRLGFAKVKMVRRLFEKQPKNRPRVAEL